MSQRPGRYDLVTRYVGHAGLMGLTGAISFDRTRAGIYFVRGAPRHAFVREGGVTLEGRRALGRIVLRVLSSDGPVSWRSLESIPSQTLTYTSGELLKVLRSMQPPTARPPQDG